MSSPLPRSKAEAEQVGSSLYLTGVPCKNGHNAPRRTSNRLCVECGRNQCLRWYAQNTDLAKQRAREVTAADPERAMLWRRRGREKNKLQINLRCRLGEIRKRTGLRIDTAAAVLYLGCSLDALREHLERQFQLGMTWGNWGRQGWHIDHIKPLLYFDLEDEDQLRIVCHYTNLQPLWWRDNIVKGHVERGHTIRAGRR